MTFMENSMKDKKDSFFLDKVYDTKEDAEKAYHENGGLGYYHAVERENGWEIIKLNTSDEIIFGCCNLRYKE